MAKCNMAKCIMSLNDIGVALKPDIKCKWTRQRTYLCACDVVHLSVKDMQIYMINTIIS